MGHLDVTVERIGIGQESDALVDGGKVNGGGLDYEVVLPAGSKLGMSLTHNETHVKHGQIGCKVAKVQDGSAAALTGKIQVHDWILAVNGITVSHDTKDDVIRAVQGVAMSGAPVTLRFRRQEVRGRRREGEREREKERESMVASAWCCEYQTSGARACVCAYYILYNCVVYGLW